MVEGKVDRITPAHAGRRIRNADPIWDYEDHPRACGEKLGGGPLLPPPLGSPPRMRGEVKLLAERFCNPGITPAHAGRRTVPTRKAETNGDHPRACGEKLKYFLGPLVLLGSPPRMRGEVVLLRDLVLLLRITPAHAGRRAGVYVRLHFWGDHPRACGEKVGAHGLGAEE